MTGSDGPRWLDALARRAARAAPATDGGLSRRTVLGAAGAAVLLVGPLRFLRPATASAQAVTLCELEGKRTAFMDFQTCVKAPLATLDSTRKAIDSLTEKLKTTTNARRRKQLLKSLDTATSDYLAAAHQLESCNLAWITARITVAATCNDTFGGGSAGGGAGPGPVCAAGTHSCAGSSPIVCCYGSDSCCPCGGSYTCCIYSDCRCCA